MTQILEAGHQTRTTVLKSLVGRFGITSGAVQKSLVGQMTIRAGAQKSLVGQMDILPYILEKSLVGQFNIARTFFPTKNFKGSMLTGRFTIFQTHRLDHRNFRFDILENTPVLMSRKWHFNIKETDADFTAKSYEVQILLDGDDVTQKVAQCSITYSVEKFCGEVSISWADWEIYDRVNVADMQKNYNAERVEVRSREAGAADWTPLGRFFLEKRDVNETFKQIQPRSWGRSTTSKLADPYARPLNQIWESGLEGAGYVMAQDVVRQICEDHGVELSWEITDYQILDGNLVAVDETPIRVIERVVKAMGGVVTTDKAGRLRATWRYGD